MPSFAPPVELAKLTKYLVSEPQVLRGLDQDVYEQNCRIVQTAQRLATLPDLNVAAVHILGSRIQGTSLTTSDVDILVTHMPDQTSHFAEHLHYDLSESEGINVEVDKRVARGFGLRSNLVFDENLLRHNWYKQPGSGIGLFHEGVYSSFAQQVGRVVATEALSTIDKENREFLWEYLCKSHNRVFLGEAGRIRARLRERLGIPPTVPDKRVLSDAVMEERYRKFGLPSFDEQYENDQVWLAEHELTATEALSKLL